MEATAFHIGGSGEPLVLLHGFTNNWRAWTAVLPALEAHHAVFAPTLPGHFGGEPFAPGASISIEAITDAVERQLDSRGIENAHFVGNSLGGWLSLELAARGRARSVVCLCPAGGWESGSREEAGVARAFVQAKWALRLSRPWFKTIAGRPRMRAIAFRDAVARPAQLSASGALATLEAASNCSIVDELLAASRRGSLFGDLGPIDCPVTIATATEDALFPTPGHFARLRRLLPDADWVVLDGLGHVPMTDDPAQISDLILSASTAEAFRTR
jgi:pimeloyl-ACP methyl ester carboxylesterase